MGADLLAGRLAPQAPGRTRGHQSPPQGKGGIEGAPDAGLVPTAVPGPALSSCPSPVGEVWGGRDDPPNAEHKWTR